MMIRIGLAASMLAQTVAATAQAPAPPDLNRFGLVCFCNSRVATPHMAVGYDNNGAILFHARNGATREALRAAGAPATESQLRMLEDWGLIHKRGKLITTAFPVLEPVAMQALRDRLRPAAARILPALQPHAAAIKAEVARRGQPEAAYALLFSYVLDGLVWDELRTSGKLPKTDITVEHPYWAGTFWAVYPKQEDSPGTNSRSKGRVTLKMLWNPQVLQPINDFYGSKAAGGWIEAMNDGRTPPALFSSTAAKPVLVREDARDPLHSHGQAIARPVARAMLATDLSKELPSADESQRLLIGTHEMIWIILAELTREQRITTPRVLATGASTSGDLAPLVIGVVSSGDRPSTP